MTPAKFRTILSKRAEENKHFDLRWYSQFYNQMMSQKTKELMNEFTQLFGIDLSRYEPKEIFKLVSFSHAWEQTVVKSIQNRKHLMARWSKIFDFESYDNMVSLTSAHDRE